VTPEAADDLIAYLRDLKLDAELLQELERCRPAWQRWLQTAPRQTITPELALDGLTLLARGATDRLPSADEVAADYGLVMGAPRLAALCSLLHYLLLHGRDFDLSLLPLLQPLEDGALPLACAAARLATLSAAADLPARAGAHNLDEAFVQDVLVRLAELTLADPGGVFLADLPDLAYDLRLASYYAGGYSFSLQSFYGPIAVLDCPDPLGQVVLPLDGTRFDSAGYLAPPETPGPNAWTAHAQRQGSALEANAAVSADGLCRQQALRLELDGVTTALQPGDEALELHVQRGADLSPEAFGSAVQAARAHYRRHFPERRPRAVFMVSWLLDAVVRDLLPQTTRIRRFQSLFRLYPARYDAAYARDCILRSEAIRPTTSLQRSLLALERAGGRLREGGGFILLS